MGNIYVVITTSLIENNYDLRYKQYIEGITQTIKVFQNIPKIKIIIVENTGKSSSFLDSFGIPVLYTNTNNTIQTNNKGIKELTDVFEVINHFNIKDEDFLIKVLLRKRLQDKTLIYVVLLLTRTIIVLIFKLPNTPVM